MCLRHCTSLYPALLVSSLGNVQKTAKPKESLLKVAVAALIALAYVAFSRTVEARTISFDKKFSNCAALNAVYPGGIAKSIGTVNLGGKTKLSPYVSAKLYNGNKSRDRDGDGIACER